MATAKDTSAPLLVRIPDPELKERFRMICEAKRTTMSQAVRDYIITVVARNGDIIEEARNASE